MFKLIIEVDQGLEVSAPQDPEALNDAIATIQDPDPYLDDEPCQIQFRAEVIKADTTLDAGTLKSLRKNRLTGRVFPCGELIVLRSG